MNSNKQTKKLSLRLFAILAVSLFLGNICYGQSIQNSTANLVESGMTQMECETDQYYTTLPNKRLEKLQTAEQKIDYYQQQQEDHYTRILRMPYELPWEKFTDLSLKELQAIESFITNEQQLKGDNFYQVFAIILESYKK